MKSHELVNSTYDIAVPSFVMYEIERDDSVPANLDTIKPAKAPRGRGVNHGGLRISIQADKYGI